MLATPFRKICLLFSKHDIGDNVPPDRRFVKRILYILYKFFRKPLTSRGSVRSPARPRGRRHSSPRGVPPYHNTQSHRVAANNCKTGFPRPLRPPATGADIRRRRQSRPPDSCRSSAKPCDPPCRRRHRPQRRECSGCCSGDRTAPYTGSGFAAQRCRRAAAPAR